VRFREISLSIEILSDPAKRTYVDTRLETDRKRKEKYAQSDKKRKDMIDVRPFSYSDLIPLLISPFLHFLWPLSSGLPATSSLLSRSRVPNTRLTLLNRPARLLAVLTRLQI
jgi:hypothetical protein